jgi:hypothetical protein
MELQLALEGRFETVMNGAADAVRNAGRLAAQDVGIAVRDELREDLARGLGARMRGGWAMNLYPSSGHANDYAIWIYPRSASFERIIKAQSQAELIITPDGKQLLAVPIPDSPAASLRGGRGGGTKVEIARRRFGELKVIPGVPGVRPAMLVAENVGMSASGRLTVRRTRNGRAVGDTRRDIPVRYGRGSVTVPLFWLVPQVRLRGRLNTFRIFERAARRYEARLAYRLQERLRQAASAHETSVRGGR